MDPPPIISPPLYHPSNPLEFFKQQFLSRLKTGNEFLDTLLIIVLIQHQDKAFGLIRQWTERSRRIIWIILKSAWYRRFSLAHSVYVPKTLETTVKYITDDREINTLYEPLVWDLDDD